MTSYADPIPQHRFASSAAGRGRTFVYGLLGGLGYALGMMCMYREGDAVLGLVTWSAVLALSLLALRATGPMTLALGVLVGSIPGTLITHQYMLGVALAGYILFPLFMSFWVAAYVWVVARISRGPLRGWTLSLLPCIWVGLEYMRGECVMGGYPWYSLGHVGAAKSTLLSATARLGGVYYASLTLSMCLIAGLWLVDRGRVKDKPYRLFGEAGSKLGAIGCAGCIVFVAALAWPVVVREPATFEDGRTLRIACIQTNMSRDDKIARSPDGLYEHAQRWYELSRQAAAAGAELIIWPETMYGGYSLDDNVVSEVRRAGLVFTAGSGAPSGTPVRIYPISFYEDLMALQREINVPMLIGSTAYDHFRVSAPTSGGPVSITFDRRYNSLFLVQNGLADQRRYDKRRLVPFGEYLPLIRYIPGATKWVADAVGSKVPLDCTAGDHLRTFEVSGANSRGPVRIITPICFEAVYGSTVREMAWVNGARAADLIVNISNDNWFGESRRDRYAHLVNAAWRSIETGLPTVRCVNTGISCVIGADGKVIHAKVMPAGSVVPPGQGDKADPVGMASNNTLTEGVLLYDVPIPDAAWKGTIYSRIGDVVPITCTVITGACVLLAVFGRRAGHAFGSPPAQPRPADRPQETPR